MACDPFPSQMGPSGRAPQDRGRWERRKPHTSATSRSHGAKRRHAATEAGTLPLQGELRRLREEQRRQMFFEISVEPLVFRPLGFSAILQGLSTKFSISFQAACSQQSPRSPGHRVPSSQLCTGPLLTCKRLQTQTRMRGTGAQPFFCYRQPPTSAMSTRHSGCSGASSLLPAPVQALRAQTTQLNRYPWVLGPPVPSRYLTSPSNVRERATFKQAASSSSWPAAHKSTLVEMSPNKTSTC